MIPESLCHAHVKADSKQRKVSSHWWLTRASMCGCEAQAPPLANGRLGFRPPYI